MKIGFVTNWTEQEIGLISRAFAETLAPGHKVFIYHRGRGLPPCTGAGWIQFPLTQGKNSRLVTPDTIDWNDFKAWIVNNHLEMVLFFDQHSWDVVIKCHSLPVLTGAYVDYCSNETLPFFRLYDFLICSTLRHYNLFREHPQAIYVPWGTDLNLFNPDRHPTLHGVVRFLHSAGLGSPGTARGTDALVCAFQQVRGEVQLIIQSQAGFEHASSYFKAAQGDPRITFIEKVEPMPSLYFLGDVYVYPTRKEGLGSTIVEALASSLPVITTDSPPMNEYIRKDYNGRLVTVERYEPRADHYYWPESIPWEISLAQAMQFYADHPEQVILQKSHARQYAEDHLDWKVNSAGLAERLKGIKPQSKPLGLRLAARRFELAQWGEDHLLAGSSAANARQASLVIRNLLRAFWFAPQKLFDRRVPAILFLTLRGFFLRW